MQSKSWKNYKKELGKQQRVHFSALVRHARQNPEKKEYPAFIGGEGPHEWALLRHQKYG